MVKSFLFILLILFAVIGICEFIYTLKMFFFFPGERVNNYVFIILKSNYAVSQLNYMWQKIKWYGDAFAIGIIGIIDNLEPDEIMICDNFINGKNIVLCNMKSLSECLDNQGEFFNEYH